MVSQHESLVCTPERHVDGGSAERRMVRQDTGGSSTVNVGYTSPRSGGEKEKERQERPQMGRLDSNGFLQPGNTKGLEGRSASFIAATLAASRSASLSPNVTGQSGRLGSGDGNTGGSERNRPSMSRSPSRRKRSSDGMEREKEVDSSSIPPTNSLIGMFEKNNDAREMSRPRRAQTAKIDKVEDVDGVETQSEVGWRARMLSSPTPKRRQHTPPMETRSPPPRARTPPKQILTQPTPTLESGLVPQLKPKPKLKPKPGLLTESSTNSTESFVQAPIPIPPRKHSIKNMSNTLSPTSAETRPQPPPRRISPQKQSQQKSPSSSHLSLDSANFQINAMANAIVASSLASSRAASPAKQSQAPPPPPPSRRNHRSTKDHFFSSSHHKDTSRTPSPIKQNGLRTTMRKPNRSPSPDEGAKRRNKKHNIMKKHPNKHAEGDRKRWRDSITERERKRYEAVWASNKGLHVFPPFEGSEGVVCNLVVKDVFSRSRLHFDVLEEVYLLIDRKGAGYLEREEFVVGLWLIDQRLKGRKLPVRVSDHVWRSVGGLQGIKVKKAYKG